MLTATPGSTSPKRSSEKRGSRRDRSRDRRRRTDTPDKHGYKYQDAQYGNSYASNGSDYSYNDKLSDHHSTGKGAELPYNGSRYDRNSGDGFSDVRSEGGYPNTRQSRDYRNDFDYNKEEKYGDQYYTADYQYYSDKYGNISYPPEEGYGADKYYDKPPATASTNKHDRYYDNSSEYHSDTYTADQYNTKYSPPEKYPETTTYSPEKVPEPPLHSSAYGYSGESYTEEFVRKSLDRRPSSRKMENGRSKSGQHRKARGKEIKY